MSCSAYAFRTFTWKRALSQFRHTNKAMLFAVRAVDKRERNRVRAVLKQNGVGGFSVRLPVFTSGRETGTRIIPGASQQTLLHFLRIDTRPIKTPIRLAIAASTGTTILLQDSQRSRRSLSPCLSACSTNFCKEVYES